MIRKVLFFLLVIGVAISAKAQLGDIHYLPPLKQGQNNAGIQQQAVYLSTPEPTAFTVNVYQGTNPTAIASYTISNANGSVHPLADGDNNITLVNNANTGVVLTNSGLRFVAPSGNRFYVNYRGRSANQAASLTAKGRQALGTNFRWGGVPNLGAHVSKSNTLGIMASEDNTTVTLSGYDPDCTFRLGANEDGITDNTYTITLDANESFVFENYVGTRNFPSHVDGWLGASVLSNKPIVISNGAMNFGTQAGASHRDAGIDQPVPINNVGKDYIFVRGNGPTIAEFPVVIGTADNTDIFLQGSATAIATIDNGEYFKIPTTYFSAATVGANMFVQTSKDVYAYQSMAGDPNKAWTQGLNFVAPIDCLLPDFLDNIPDITNIAGGTPLTGGLIIIASTSTPDANIKVYEDGVEITKPAPNAVLGTPDWKTFFIDALDGDINAESTGPMAVGFFGYDGNRGVAGYFSGFDTAPEVILDIASGAIGDCFSDANIFVATENFDAYQWFFEGVAIPGANAINHSDTRAGDYFVRGTKGPCTYDSDLLNIFYCDPEVSIIKTVADPEITEGETTVFIITAESYGFEDVTGLQVFESLPSEVTLVSTFASTGSWDAASATWNIGTLAPGIPVTLELTVRGNEIDIEPLLNVKNEITYRLDQTEANPSQVEDILEADLIIHNDFDNDGVIDIVDLDDDNDGVYDEDECTSFFCFESILNESFEEPAISSGFLTTNQSNVPGWLTTATDGRIEIWRSGFMGVDSYNGNQHAELNANLFGALYQNLCLTPGTVMNWSFRHRGRNGIDEMQLRIGADLASATVQQTMSSDNDVWTIYSGIYTVPLGQNNTVFIFEAVSTASGSNSNGNFIDDVKINIAVPPTCIDTDGDGYPDNIDLDRDNDGCTDADEWYKDNNADADDGGEFGSGVPAVDPIDGTVIAASYIEVLAPQILLENTSETSGGLSLTGQDVSLGDTFDYVLRFQNNGDDDATGYSIRNVLPLNVTIDNINILGAPGVSPSTDPLFPNVITFQVPDNLVQVGDSQFEIRITVSLSANCAVFVNACSGTLENIAYSTYQGRTNTNTYSDEPNSTNLPVCSPPAPTATNSLLNDLANCNVARTALLCGESATLNAGTGFTNYVWAIDANGNGQIDASEPPINDGNPDNDLSTLVVTTIGNYIVEKSGAAGCADLVELITVENFGATQTNPITAYFNQVNNDANADNDIQGQIVACSIDGIEIPELFLCGENDDVLIQLGITDRDSIVWQKLDEASCSAASLGCANTNGSCTWVDLVTEDFYNITDAGQYRIVINYDGGCFSRFYFNVFKNTLDIDDPIISDIICNTAGNIRMTNPVTGFGFQLVDLNTDNVIVPFSANNGPNFDITAPGSYKVQLTQLDPSGNPIVGACIFETDPIGILERMFDVVPSSEPADCTGFGEITMQALNVRPNYNYRLFLDNGTTLVEENLGNSDNTYTFSTVPAGDYVVVTSTDDGCSLTQNVTVAEIPELDLSAAVSEHITCNTGLISLSPSGGDPDPDYQMAIWSINNADQFTSIADAVADATAGAPEFQTTNDFLFPNDTDAGDYIFIVIDSNGCHDFSNAVTLLNLGPIVVSENHTAITCSGAETSTVTITASGGTTIYEYSLDGVFFQTTNAFTNLGAGSYTITVRDSSGSLTSRCIETLDFKIEQPFELNASATIVEDIACDVNDTLVKILNANGGQAPYLYSFDGGSTFDPSNERRLAAGTYQLVLRDALECTLNLEIIVPNAVADPVLTAPVTYDCIGEGTITVNTSNTTDFNYTYALNGIQSVPNSNIFNNVPVGIHTVTVDYSSALTPAQSNFIVEDFGTGSNSDIEEVGPGYCYESQDANDTGCELGPDAILVNGEYSVTSFVTNPIPSWRSPNDFNGLTDGRFMAIAVSTTPGPANVLWQRTGLEVLPNQEITFSFQAFNILRTGQLGNNPEVLVELVDASGIVIASLPTLEIPKNNDADDWHLREVTFNPGANTTVGIVLRTNLDSDDGNLLAIDDIQGSQLPVVCERTQDVTVVVEANQAFEAQLLSANEPSCNAGDNASIRFEVLNFPATGFQYTINGTTATSMVSEVTTTMLLTAGNYTVQIESLPLGGPDSCTTDFMVTIDEPTVILPELQLTADFTCENTGATLEASATGGTPGYEYQLESTPGGAGNIQVAYQTSTTFTNVPQGEYLVRVRDANQCPILLPLTDAITVDAPETVVFNTTPTACYTGASNGSIVVEVTAGNGNYEFRLDGGAWIPAMPSTPTTHIFTGLTEGNYDIEVRDQFRCPNTPNTVTVVIADQLIVDVDITPLSACDDGEITVNVTGGNGIILYAIVPANTSPTGLYNTTKTLTVTEAMATANPAGYDVYVQDNNGGLTACSVVNEDIILTPVTALTVLATPTNPQCFDGQGMIDVTLTGGTAPFTYNLIDLSPADGIDYSSLNTNISTTTFTFNGIGLGDYEVAITDTNGCRVTSSIVTINNAIEITADIIPILPPDCDNPLNTVNDFGFRFDNVTSPTGTIEYSSNGGSSWQVSNELRGHLSGTEVFPSIRVTLANGAVCQKDFDRYIIPFPLDNLDITLSALVVDCNDLQVTVRGQQGDGTSGYDYTYTDDPANFNTFIMNPAVWVNNIPAGTSYTFENIDAVTPQYPEVPLLIPGRTYVFYVRDGLGCIRQSDVNINEITNINLPIEITADITPTCDGTATGEITFNLNPTTSYPNMRWEIYEVGNTTPLEVSGGGATAINVPFSTTIATLPLSEGDFYIDVIQVDGANQDQCRGASENVYVPELAPLAATVDHVRDISCNLPGLIAINNISGGGGAPYTYDVSGPAGFTTLTGTVNNPVQIPVNSPAGDYTITIYDQYGCITPLGLTPVRMELSPNPTITVAQDNCVAPITVTATGGSLAGNMRFAIVPTGDAAPTTFEDNAGVFTNVLAGSYDVYVIDGNGCTATETNFTVNPVLSARAGLTKLLDCTASPDAVINIEVLDGSGSYEYSITNTATNPVPPVNQTIVPGTNFNYLAPEAGDYTITIYDTTTPSSPVCDRVFVINVPEKVEPIIDPNIVITNVSCFGANDGSFTISTTSSAGGPFSFEIISFDGAPVSITSTLGTSATFTGLAPTTTPGGYVVSVRGDAATNNCDVTSVSIEISEPTDISLTIPPAAFGCTSGDIKNNAIITANANGGSGTFDRYQFVDVATTNILQNGPSDTYVYTAIAGGIVEVTAFDDSGCSETSTITIAPYDELQSVTINVLDPKTCVSSDEDIEFNIVGSETSSSTHGTNFEIRQLPSTVYEAPGDVLFNNLPIGTYTFGIRNITTGCEIFVDHTVEDPNTYNVVATPVTNAVCFGDDGSITITFSDGTYTGVYNWEIRNADGSATTRTDDAGTFTGNGTIAGIPVAAGSFMVRVTQADIPGPQCAQERFVTITTPPAPITLDPVIISSVNCSNNQGTAQITPQGGVAPYTIEIEHVASGLIRTTAPDVINAFIFNGLSAGDYNVTVIDALGCPAVFANEFSLEQPDPIDGVAAFDELECRGDNTSTVRFVINPTPPRNTTPDVPDYNYSLNTYDDALGTNTLRSSAAQPGTDFNDLGAGFYSITVTDNLGCDFTTDIIRIIEPDEVEALLVIDVAITCDAGAELLLTASGGTGVYTWSTDRDDLSTYLPMNNGDTHLFQNVPVGSYNYYIRDDNNCLSIISNTVTINPIVPLSVPIISVTPLACFDANTAIIIADAEGGLGEYEYALFNRTTNTQVGQNQDNGTFTDLENGTYYVRVEGRGNCEEESIDVFIENPNELLIVATPSEITCAGENDGSISIEVEGGTEVYQYAISPNLNQFISGDTPTSHTFEELSPDIDYLVIIQDSNGCTEFFEYRFVDPEPLTMTLSATPEICVGQENGTITITPAGGTPPYRMAIDSDDPADFVDLAPIDNLAGGEYSVYIMDTNGCITDDFTIIDSGANINATIEVIYECSSDTPTNRIELTLEDPSVATDVLYVLDSTNAVDGVDEPNFENLSPGTHFVYILHSNGCPLSIDFEIENFEPLELALEQLDINEISAEASGGKEGYTYYFDGQNNGDDNTFGIRRTDTYEVRVVDDNGCETISFIEMEFIDIEIPNFFTPDGDGLNDFWMPKNVSQFPEIFIKIFDRYGREVFRIQDTEQGWNGFYNQTELPTGDYWYIIQLNGQDDDREFVGNFTLYR